MKKSIFRIAVLTLTTLFFPLHVYAGDILLGDEPSFKGWEGRGGMIRIKNAEPEQASTKGPEPIKAVGQATSKEVDAAKASGPYVGFGGGISMNHDADFDIDGIPVTVDVEYDLGYGFNLVAGYNFNPIRVEAEFAYRVSDIDKISALGESLSISGSELKTMSYMANAYYDIQTGTAVMPFLGVGLGVIDGELDGNGAENLDDTVFGYQLTAGITGTINKNVNLDCYYRFQASGSDFEKYGGNLSYTNSSVFAAMRFDF